MRRPQKFRWLVAAPSFALWLLGTGGSSALAHTNHIQDTELAQAEPIGPAEDTEASAVAPSPHTAASANAETEEALPPRIFLELGQLQSLKVEEVSRVAVGSPDIVDITVVSPNELLLQAKATGTTNLILWDRRGQHTSILEVIDHAPQAAEEQLRQLLHQLNLTDVQVKRENGKLFLVGQVRGQPAMTQVEQMLTAFPSVNNLIQVIDVPPAPSGPPPPLVKLSVQVIEISRSDLEKLGVKWSESLALTEQPFASRAGTPDINSSLVDTLDESVAKRFGEPFRIGTLFRTGIRATINALVEQSKARLLAEPKLVTASGKEASSFIGVEVPIVVATSFGTTTSVVSTSIEFRETGVLLKMTPSVQTVEAGERITTVIEAEVSDIDKTVGLNVPVGTQTVLVPGFKVRKANTEVTTASGETIMIAGLLESKDSKAVSQVPALGSMPVLGRLFRSPELKDSQLELVIAVTPELLADADVTTEKAVALERALAVAKVTPTVEDPRLRYALQVQDRLASSIRYPSREKEQGRTGQVKLRLHLFRDGTLGGAMVLEPSGNASFDAEALKAAENQSPYPPFPADLLQQDLWVEVPVLFRP